MLMKPVPALDHGSRNARAVCFAGGLCAACSEGHGVLAPDRADAAVVVDALPEVGVHEHAVPTGPRTGLHVEGNRLVDGGGQTVSLHGVGRQGTEYRCSKYGGIFDGPSDQSSIDVMVSWNVNAVRVFLNEDCWLGINCPSPADSGEPIPNPADFGEPYVAAIRDYVALLEHNGITPILDLQLGAPGRTLANYPQLPMADRDHSPDFWRSVGETFAEDTAVVFDLYNEPYPDGDQDTAAAWTCWRDGGACPGLDYEAAGMQELVDAVRGAGAKNLLLVAGVRYGNVLSHWREYRPVDSGGNLAPAWHVYDVSYCRNAACWNDSVAPVMDEYPLVATEIGEFDCRDWFVQGVMAFLEAKGGSYSANAWNAGPGWPCGSSDATSGPSLIADFAGTPTPYGQGYRDHLLSLP
jgi:endoglucanase